MESVDLRSWVVSVSSVVQAVEVPLPDATKVRNPPDC